MNWYNLLWILRRKNLFRCKDGSQYCSVKDFQLGIWFGEKVKGLGLKVFSCPFSPSSFALNRQVLRWG
ncbi:hypothetical protein FDUTEX481_08988 [Tolypothrix sp. PCC 7601]|nr:hypothetical protein FDUTEX481_08988 [Tolypothrix sp. PCC 7601]